LEGEGFVCAEAADGEEGLDLVDKDTYDLMILDVRMPGIGGLDVLREVRNKTRTLPIVMVTALGDPEIAATALTESGANAFVGKPCSTYQLLNAIERAIAA
jgi:DNA-binding response OmpR family regulator